MTPILIDTSCLLALTDVTSTHHASTTAVVRDRQYERIIAGPVLPEATYLMAKRLGYDTARRFITNLAVDKPTIEQLLPEDYSRVAEIMNRYADMQLDFADAAIMTLAERLNITHILTLDHRDFRVLRPKHCAHFELLP